MTIRSRQERESQAERNRQALVASEAALLGMLFGASRGSHPVEIEAATAGAILVGRGVARRTARAAILSDLAALGATPGGPGLLVSIAVTDAARAIRAARSIAAKAAEALRQGDGRRLSEALRPKLQQVAATESAHAYNGERKLVAEQATSGGAIRLLKVWDAVLDRRTCPTCSGLDGTIVGIGESFPLEQPVHPLCRCTFTLLSSDEQESTVQIRPVAAR